MTCKRTDVHGSAMKHKTESGRLKTARTAENVECVSELICSQEDDPGTSKSTRQIAQGLQMSEKSVLHCDYMLCSVNNSY